MTDNELLAAIEKVVQAHTDELRKEFEKLKLENAIQKQEILKGVDEKNASQKQEILDGMKVLLENDKRFDLLDESIQSKLGGYASSEVTDDLDDRVTKLDGQVTELGATVELHTLEIEKLKKAQ